MSQLHIQFTLFSAFYSPLIVTLASGFLKDEGLDATWSVAPPGTSAIKALLADEAQVIQSAPSQGFATLKEGREPEVLHFAQVNEMDGFFVSGRSQNGPAASTTEPGNFDWKQLEGAEVVIFKAGQPNIMFRYACHKAGIDYEKIIAITPGGADAIDAAFREGQGSFVQQQGPYPQQLEADGVGSVLAECGPLIGKNAFSSLAARPEWLGTDQAKSFTKAYTKARHHLNNTPADEIARQIAPYFVEAGQKVDDSVLAKCIGTYQKMGCWSPHIEITQAAYDATLEIFQHAGGISEDYPYEKVCARPPA